MCPQTNIHVCLFPHFCIMNDYNIFSAVSVNSTYLSVMNILLIIEQSTTEHDTLVRAH